MIKYFFVFIISFILLLNIHSREIIDNNYLIFDDLGRNPANTGDSTTLNFNSCFSWHGYYGYSGHFSVDKNISQINSGLGLHFDLNGEVYRSFGLLYSKSFTFDKLKIDLGTLIGYSTYHIQKFSYPYYLPFSNNEYVDFNRFRLAIGGILRFKKQNFGVSFNKEIFPSKNIDGIYFPKYINESYLIIDYGSDFKLTNSISILPKLLIKHNFEASTTNPILSLGIGIFSKYKIGVMNNSFDSFTYYLTCNLFHKIELGGFLSLSNITGTMSNDYSGLMLKLKL